MQIDKDKVVVPIEYQVIGTDDGSVMYRWDAATFGKDFISRALTGALANAGASPPAEEPSPSSEAAPTAESDHAEALQAAMNRWHNEVRSDINAEVGKSNVEGSGTVGVEFSVSDSGAISNVRVTRNSGNTALDAAAVKIIESRHCGNAARSEGDCLQHKTVVALNAYIGCFCSEARLECHRRDRGTASVNVWPAMNAAVSSRQHKRQPKRSGR